MRLKAAYLILCVLGVALPYWQFAPWLLEHGPDLPLFLHLRERSLERGG